MWRFLGAALIVALVSLVALRIESIEDSRAETMLLEQHVERPLPYLATWNTGEVKKGSDPTYQMRLIDQGHKLLLSLLMPDIEADPDDPRWISYYEPSIRRAAQLKLPIALVGTQWEARLSTDSEYVDLPPASNPNVVTADGAVHRQVSPFGGIAPWKDVGRKWSNSRMMRKLQALYPDPPLVLFVSNNEHPKLEWMNVEEDSRYLRQSAREKGDEHKRRAAASGWVERYRALQDGMRRGLENPVWRERALFIAYEAFGPSHLGRWPGWQQYALYTPGRISPWPLAWDGASVSYYLFNWLPITDFTVFSPQVEAMNWVFMQEEAQRLNPDFWLEISTWDGHEPGSANDKYETFKKLGQRFTPERYGGLVQFGLWLLRPRGVREFRFIQEKTDETQAFLLPLVAAVDRVHDQPELRDFWQNGTLVANQTHSHPYQEVIPPEYRQVPRWFLLDTSADPKRPWELTTRLPVFSLALVKGEAPSRKWLVYAHAPMGARMKVNVTIPQYRVVNLDVSVAGSFYVLEEQGSRVRLVF